MAGLPIVGLFVSFLLYFDSSQGFVQTDVSCKPRKTLVPLDAPYYDKYPFFAEVFRCAGGCTTFKPTFHHCVAKTSNNVSGQVYSLSTEKELTVVVENHTSCDCACAQSTAAQCSENEVWREDQCSCLCRYSDVPPSPCPTGLSWRKDECKCVCRKPVQFCSFNKEWSQTYCGCVCTRFAAENCKAENKNLNTTTCECEDAVRGPGVTGKRSGLGFTSTMLLMAMFVELLILVILFDLYLFWRYRKGVCHWLYMKCCASASPKGSNNGQPMMSTAI